MPTDFTNGSIPSAFGGFLIEQNPGLTWLSDLLTALDMSITNSTASRILSTDSSKKIVSISDLTAWIAGSDLQPVNDDGDGTVSLNDDELEFYIQAVA